MHTDRLTADDAQPLTLSTLSTASREEITYGSVSIKFKKHRDQLQALHGIDPATYGDYVFMAFDKVEKSGQKVFSAIPRAEWHKIAVLLASDRNGYEWILSSTAVRPYWDLEMESDDMTREKAAGLFEIFLLYLCGAFNAVFDAAITRADFTILNSSRPGKLSYHILITDGFYFGGTADHKLFMQWFAREFEAAPAAVREATIWTKKEAAMNIFDMSVYANNQKFRCINQTKKGKPYPLVLESPRDIAAMDTMAGLYRGVGARRRLNVEALIIDESAPPSKTSKKSATPRAAPAQAGGFITAGASMHTKSGETYEQLLTRPDESQYLRLIPNYPPQSWEFYRNTAYMAFLAGVPKAEFEAWVQLSATFDARDPVVATYDRQKSKAGYDAAGAIGYLRKHAKIAAPDFFKTAARLHAQYYKPDFSGFETITERSAFVSQEGTEWARDIESPHRILLLKADLGAGKTTAIKRILPRYPRILIITPRIAYCKHAVVEFGVADYLEGDFAAPRLACSLESLYRIPADAVFDIVILDECEAILSIFSSMTLKGRQVETYAALTRLLAESKKAIFAGAFITQKTVDFVAAFEVSTLLIRHEKPPAPDAQPKRAVEVEYDLFNGSLIEYIEKGGKPYVYWASKAAADRFLLELKGAARKEPVLMTALEGLLFYKADGDDAVFQNLNNINEAWDAAAFVMATPSITVGNSYSPPQTTFSSVWIYGYPSCIVADIFQGHKRVRRTTTGDLYFLIPYAKQLQKVAAARGELLATLSAFDDLTSERREVITAAAENQRARAIERGDYAGEFEAIIRSLGPEYEQTPAPLRALLFFNHLEADLSARFFRSMFLSFVVMCGYTVEKKTAAEKKELIAPGGEWDRLADVKAVLEADVVKEPIIYADIQVIDYGAMEELQRRIRRRDASSAQKLQVKRFFFDLRIDPELSPEAKRFYFTLYCDANEAHTLRNMFAEAQKRATTSFCADFFEKSTSAESLTMGAVKLATIREINRRLGVGYSMDKTPISREKIEEIGEYLLAERRTIHTTFKLREQNTRPGQKERQNNTGAPTFKASLELLNKIYGSWVGGKLYAAEGDESRTPKSYYLFVAGPHSYSLPPPYRVEIDSNDEYIRAPLGPHAELIAAMEEPRIPERIVFVEVEGHITQAATRALNAQAERDEEAAEARAVVAAVVAELIEAVMAGPAPAATPIYAHRAGPVFSVMAYQFDEVVIANVKAGVRGIQCGRADPDQDPDQDPEDPEYELIEL